ncbi:high nitrogen upregulated cytochrome P450 monooxygenase 2 [Amylostereum chailletii]|nr:high nitrogen upregulated cytochrome P450 monooxygenase 2 [Amylostereum chailletii]
MAYLYFKRNEPDSILALFFLLVLVPALLSAAVSQVAGPVWVVSVLTSLTYLFLLLFFTAMYRVSPFHPLARYPGPFPAKITKWWSSYIITKGKQHLYYQALHERYGDVVRVGPNELSFRDASFITDILGPDGLPKGPCWDNRTSAPSLIAQRDPVAHAQQRRPWNRAFSSAAMKDYEVIIAQRARQLVHRWEDIILAQPGNVREATLDVGAWMGYFSTDFMGDMAFGGGFELMRDGGDTSGVWHVIETGMQATTIFAHAPWAAAFLKRMPGQGAAIQSMREFCWNNVQKRMALGAARKDLYYHLSDEDDQTQTPPTLASLAANGVLAIVAGSDTTAMVLTSFLYHVLRHPTVYKRFREEVDATFPDGQEPLDVTKLSGMPWLNSCLNEVMRLQPPVPSGSQRRVPRGAGPKVLGRYVVPEETQLFVHTYSIQRDARNFSNPDAFLPERWMPVVNNDTPSAGLPASTSPMPSSPKHTSVHNPAAFIPFSYGPRNCVGKNLALTEARMLIAYVVSRFDFHPVGEEGSWEDTLSDYFTFQKGALPMRVTLREAD